MTRGSGSIAGGAPLCDNGGTNVTALCLSIKRPLERRRRSTTKFQPSQLPNAPDLNAKINLANLSFLPNASFISEKPSNHQIAQSLFAMADPEHSVLKHSNHLLLVRAQCILHPPHPKFDMLLLTLSLLSNRTNPF